MSTRTGKGSLSLNNPSKAKLRAIGRKGNETYRRTAAENKRYTDIVPF
jgi:hypothetical protein